MNLTNMTNDMLTLIPRLRDFAVVRKEHSGTGFVLNPFIGELRVNWIGIDIARLCGGNLSGSQIAGAIGQKYSLTSVDATKVVTEALQRFHSTHLLDWIRPIDVQNGPGNNTGVLDEAWETLALARYRDKNCFTAPLNVIWEITGGCNLRCKHCLTGSGEFLDSELTTEEVFRIIDELVQMQVLRISFVGGEPLMRRDLFDILAYCSEKNVAIEFSTNGYAFTEKELKRLDDLNVFSLQVSIDGLGDSHDDFRGRSGSFQKAIRALELARDGGLKVTISTTATRTNYLQIPAMIDYFHDLNIPMVSYKAIPFLPVGRGKENDSELCLTPEQIKVYSGLMLAKKKEKGDSFVVDNEGAYTWLFSDPDSSLPVPDEARVGCGAGRNLIVFGADGTVYPCPFLHDFPSGNLREQSFSDIWLHSKTLACFRGITKGDLQGKCRECPYLPGQCSGGCRAAAYARTGSIFAEDPCCWSHLR